MWLKSMLTNMKKIIRNLKRKWWYNLISNPDIYLKSLMISALGVGIVTAIIYFLFKYYGGHTDQETIPPAFHSILGVVLGLLLVFRTNTAYDRWWKGREYLSKIEMNYIYMRSKIDISVSSPSIKRETIDCMSKSLDLLELFLMKDNRNILKTEFLSKIHTLHSVNKTYNYDIDHALRDVLDNFTALERIRDTPIPQSYSLHIKVSIFMYFLTLPFGILYTTGYWSILLVMILYYIVAGIEIISNEIENPFFGDPNDLPVKEFIRDMKNQIV